MVDRILERFANAGIIALALVVCVQLAAGRFWPATTNLTAHASQRRQPPKLEGVSISTIRPEPDRGGLLLLVSPSCRFCESSVPFYQQLNSRLSGTGLSFLIAVTQGPVGGDPAQYLAKRGLSYARAVPPEKVRPLGLPGTPTILAYDSEGTVKGAWFGALNQQGQTEVTAALANLASRN